MLQSMSSKDSSSKQKKSRLVAVNHMVRYSDFGKRFFQRKLAQRNRAVAVKATANKLAKACFYMDKVAYDPKRLFT